MVKKVFILIVLLALCFSAFSEELFTLRSEHFEFIYPEPCEETALILYENAERLYNKATSLLKTDEVLFIPVYITPDTQELNAYFTPFPYNRIVFFDTPPDSFSLSSYKDTKVSVFYHELVHAVSMNIRDGFWSFLSSFLGDGYSPSYLFTSSLSFLEGATVSFESMDGDGRLNSGDSMAYLVQAKLEDNFPGWKDASGPRDIFPKANYAYLFGGAFNRHIQNKYGMDKYVEFWEKCGGISFFSSLVDGSFKAVYGIPLEEEWSVFEETIPVPTLSTTADVKMVSKKPSYDMCLAFRNGAEKGIAFLENGSFITYVPVDAATGQPGLKKHLLLADGGVSSLSFSNDGRYLFITGIGTNIARMYSLKIYDMETEQYVSEEVYPLAYSCLADVPEYGSFVVGMAIRNGRACFEIRDLEGIRAFGNSAAVLFSEELPVYTEVYGVAAVGSKVFSLEKIRGEWAVSVYEFAAKENHCFLRRNGTYFFPDGIIPSSFAYAGDKDGKSVFYCAVAGKGLSTGTNDAPGSLSRLLTVEFPATSDGEALLSLGREDVSGGVHNPFYDAATDTLYFIARKSESLDVSFCGGIPGGSADIGSMQFQKADGTLFLGQREVTEASSAALEGRGTYNAFKYLFPGTFLPVGADLISMTGYLPGISWMLMDPTEQVKLLFSGGWNPLEKTGGISFKTWGGPSFLSYNASFTAEFNASGLASSKENLVLSGSIPVWTRNQAIQYSDTVSHEFVKKSAQTLLNSIDLSYALSYKTGKGYYDKLFFTSGVSFLTECIFNPQDKNSIYNNLGFNISAGVGGPVPISVNATLMRNSKRFLNLGAEAVLFSTEIQKGVPLFPLYANRFTITAGYEADWMTTRRNMLILDFHKLITKLPSLFVKHGVKCGVNFTLAPTMSLTYSFQFKFGADFTWYFRNEQDKKLYDLVLCGVFTF